MVISFDGKGDTIIVDPSPMDEVVTISFPLPPAGKSGWRSVAVVLNGKDVQVYVDGEELDYPLGP